MSIPDKPPDTPPISPEDLPTIEESKAGLVGRAVLKISGLIELSGDLKDLALIRHFEGRQESREEKIERIEDGNEEIIHDSDVIESAARKHLNGSSATRDMDMDYHIILNPGAEARRPEHGRFKRAIRSLIRLHPGMVRIRPMQDQQAYDTRMIRGFRKNTSIGIQINDIESRYLFTDESGALSSMENVYDPELLPATQELAKQQKIIKESKLGQPRIMSEMVKKTPKPTTAERRELVLRGIEATINSPFTDEKTKKQAEKDRKLLIKYWDSLDSRVDDLESYNTGRGERQIQNNRAVEIGRRRQERHRRKIRKLDRRIDEAHARISERRARREAATEDDEGEAEEI